MLTTTLIADCGGREWREHVANLPASGGFAFFVFRVKTDCYLGDHLTGLHWCEPEEDGTYFVAGTFDQFNLACYTFCNNEAPYEVMLFYNYVYQKLSDYGYVLRGDKRQMPEGFYLV